MPSMAGPCVNWYCQSLCSWVWAENEAKICQAKLEG